MAYNAFGEFVRIQRIRHHEVMGDLAKVLGVRVPFLSAVENGKRNVPPHWFALITEHYNLTQKEQKELQEAIDESRTQYKLSVKKDTGVPQRRVAMQFARSFDNMDDETAVKILELLNKKEGN